MPKLSSTYHSKIYKEFKAIAATEHLSIVRFYESYEADIPQLNFSEYFELLVSYSSSLFEIGAYQSHTRVVDIAIEVSILNNIKFYNGQDIYTELLFKKAASCYNLMDYNQAEHILRELIKIAPYNEMAHRFLRKCLQKKQPEYLKNIKGFSILLLLFTALVIAIELLFIRTLLTDYTSAFEMVRNITFFSAILLLLGSFVFHRVEIYFWVKQFIADCKQRKS